MAEAENDVIGLVRDLMFVSRITATARAAGSTVNIVRNPENLQDATGRLLIVDLNLVGAMEAAAKWQQAHPSARVVAFVSHVDVETIARARSLGIEKIMARSRFVETLADIISS